MSTCRRSFLDSPFTRMFFEKYAKYTPPGHTTVYGTLLNEIYDDTVEKVKHELDLDNPGTLLTLTMDGWVAPQGEKVRNYMAVTDTSAFLLKATSCGGTSSTGQVIGEEVIDIIEEFGPDKFAGVVTDNAANETTSWDTIRDKYPDILATGCSCHAGSLLYKDVCEHNWASKLVEKATEVAKFMKHHTYTNAELKSRTTAAGTPMSIILHCPTRFAGSYYTVKRLLQLKSTIREIIVTDTFASKNYK